MWGGTSGRRSGAAEEGALIVPSGLRRPGPQSKPQPKAEHGSVPSLQCLCEPVGEPACSHREMKMCPGVGGRILSSCRPHAVGVGDPAHGVQWSQSLALVWGISLGGGGVRHSGRRYTPSPIDSPGGGGGSRRSALAVSTVRGGAISVCALIARFCLTRFGPRVCVCPDTSVCSSPVCKGCPQWGVAGLPYVVETCTIPAYWMRLLCVRPAQQEA